MSRLPRNAGPVVAARRAGMRPADGVVVSFVGWTDFDAPHVFCDPGVEYDLAFLAGLRTVIVLRPGIDAAAALRDLFAVADIVRAGYPTLIDVERRQLGYVVGDRPLQVMTVRPGSPAWRGVFA